MSLLFEPLVAATVPPWVWATLVMAAFVGVTIVTMILTRYPVRRAPPPVAPPDKDAPPRGDA